MFANNLRAGQKRLLFTPRREKQTPIGPSVSRSRIKDTI